MEALRIIKKITNDRLPELNNYKGKKIEIIILPTIEDENLQKNQKSKNHLINSLIGSCPNLPDGMEFQNKIRKEWDR